MSEEFFEETERRGEERRKEDHPVATERRAKLDRRRGPGRRRTDSRRSAEEGEMTTEQFEFIKAIEEYKKVNRKPFPSWTEVLEILQALGYRKVAEPKDINQT
jgi:hypothetical protein